MTALVIFAHGSPIESANEAVRTFCTEVARAGHFRLVAPAFLESGQPDLAGAIASLVLQGAKHVIIVPYFLTLGLHLQRDLPRIVAEIASSQRDLTLEVAPPLDGHPALVRIVLDRAAAFDRNSELAG